ncbi:MAG TPA: RpiB/LacA/LacB family sugar-phosphate isomerase [Candidatus Saccharimonadales bacterium]|nr:RpiB/LacA/LacB family sugar-phosphate isomerase [Candidatus Saccharimonadales bacterium]
MKVALSTDHTGLAYGGVVEEVLKHLEDLGHECVYFGPKSLDMGDDYPDFMFPAATAVASNECHIGIILGGSGQGEAMAANRIKNVRCTVFYGQAVAKNSVDAEGHVNRDPYEILRLSRQHNHANMLSLATRFLSLDEIKTAITVWLDTPYSNSQRHIRRVRKLDS